MEIQNYLPTAFRAQINGGMLKDAEEIRLRVGQPLEILYADERSRKFDRINGSQIKEMLNYLSGYSVYAIEEELRQGYFTVEGGHRIGVSGRTSYQQKGRWNEMNPLSAVSGINVRLAHERKGCALPVIPFLYHDRSIYHTFIFASPGVGKTTCLRDCIRCLSKGGEGKRGLKISVVDERSEIAACHRGIPQNDLGPRTDVLDNCPKEQGMRMLLRSMSPEVIAVDELGTPEDFAAVSDCVRCGIAVLGTIHAGEKEEVIDRFSGNGLSQILGDCRLVGLKRLSDGKRKISVYDGKGVLLWEK